MDYVLGFDGGGTKTECVLMDPAGKILARCFSGPSNPSRVGVEPATREIDKVANLSLQEARVARNAVAALGAGLAGTGETGVEGADAGVTCRNIPRRGGQHLYGFGNSSSGSGGRPCDRLSGWNRIRCDWPQCTGTNLAHGGTRPAARRRRQRV